MNIKKYIPMFTPGPWTIEKNRHGAPIITAKYHVNVLSECDREICKVFYHGGSEDNQVDNNAKLIVMAPDMLQELVITEQTLRNIGNDLFYSTSYNPSKFNIVIIENRTRTMRDLIRKATGRPDYYAWEIPDGKEK